MPHQAEIGGKEEIGLKLADILTEVSLRQAAPDEFRVQGQASIAVEFIPKPNYGIIIMPGIKSSPFC
jgi:hypothetical protein